jgi:hypothetical protein
MADYFDSGDDWDDGGENSDEYCREGGGGECYGGQDGGESSDDNDTICYDDDYFSQCNNGYVRTINIWDVLKSNMSEAQKNKRHKDSVIKADDVTNHINLCHKFIFHTRSKYSKYEKSMMVLDAVADAIETYQPLELMKSGFRVIMGETYRDNLKRIEANKTQTKILNKRAKSALKLVTSLLENCKLSLQNTPVSSEKQTNKLPLNFILYKDESSDSVKQRCLVNGVSTIDDVVESISELTVYEKETRYGPYGPDKIVLVGSGWFNDLPDDYGDPFYEEDLNDDPGGGEIDYGPGRVLLGS